MTLSAGSQLAHYKIVKSIGKGGMGEVFRARDGKLGREVAVKVLPAEVSQDRERLARFEREARLLAQVNHANVATLHGLEESDGTRFLVMELIEGETLAARIARGPIPRDEALALFKQIAAGLKAAHDKGVIHRDLKPENIKLASDGTVKILDFGLAKGIAPERPASGISESPTAIRATAAGMILGTAPYMSPEQARGYDVDKRTDIWSFGCCLYEGLIGKAAFDGDTVSDTLAIILQREPNWKALPEDSAADQVLLRRCLAKDPDRRLHDIADARLEIDDIAEAPPVAESAQKRSLPIQFVPLVSAMLLGGALVVVLNRITENTRPAANDVIRYSFALPEKTTLFDPSGFAPPLAISNDGQRLVFAATSDDGAMLYARKQDSFESTPIPGTEGSAAPFFSPDGESLGFSEGLRLSRISLSGGNALVLYQERTRGASWGTDDSVVYAPQFAGLRRIPAAGGDVETLTTFGEDTDEINHHWPQFLPDGKHVLFTVSHAQSHGLELLSLETGERRVLLEGDTMLGARFVPPEHLVFARGSELLAVRCDPATLELLGSPVRVLEGVNTTSRGSAHFAVSAAGTLVYAPGSAASAARSLVWVDREGGETSIFAGDAYEYPRLSPDGKRVVAMIHQENGNHEIWMLDVERGSRRLVYARGDNYRPVWTRDGTKVAFSSR